MDFMKLAATIIQVLPRIKTKVQITGLAVALCAGMLANFAKPGDNISMLVGGAIGILIIIFAQLFHFLGSFRERDRVLVFMGTTLLFCVMVVALVAILITRVQTAPTSSISPYDPTPDVQKKSEKSSSIIGLLIPSAHAQDALLLLETIRPIKQKVDDESAVGGDSRSASYKFSKSGQRSTLKASLGYLKQSRAGKYPDADFHEAVWWGSPWLSFNVNNPSADNLLITSAVVHVLSVQHINDLILHVPDIEGVATGKAVLKIRNAGWGMGKDGTLTLKLAKPDASREAYHVFKQFIVQSLSVDKEEVEIEIAHYLPPKTDWYTYTGNIDQGVLYLFGVYEYTQQDGRKMTETFHTTIYQTGSGGGNISETAGFNVRLPEAPTTEPIFISLANCMAPKSAAKFVFNFTAARSATYRLKLTLLTTLKTVLEEEVDVDVLVNRDQSPSPRRRSTSFIIDERVGCT